MIASGSAHGTEQLLAIVERFFVARGMSVNAAKSHVIRFAPAPRTKTVKVLTGSSFSYGGNPLRNCSIAEVVKYLGLHFSPLGTPKAKGDGVIRDLEVIRGAALKPEQKLTLMRRFVIPAHMHSLRLSRTSDQVLKRLDGALRRTARAILHLPPGTPTAFFCLKAADGGLGLPAIRDSVGMTRLKRIATLRASQDGLVSSYARSSSTLESEHRYWRRALDIGDASTRGLTAERKARPERRARQYRSTHIGGLFDARASGAGHPWLVTPRTLRGAEYVHAVHMVSESLPTRINVTRGRDAQPGERNCRRCHRQAETQLHVLNECVSTREAMIRRHNWVCNAVRDELRERDPTTQVLTEPRLSVRGREMRPDLVVIQGQKATVIDVAVTYDHRGQAIQTRYRDKIQKYEILRDVLPEFLARRHDTRVTEVSVDAIVVGSRGLLLPGCCQKPLSRLGIRERFAFTLQEGALRGSVAVWRAFLTARMPPGPGRRA